MVPPPNVIPIRHRSAKLLRQGLDHLGRPVDPYADLLATVPDVAPGMIPQSTLQELVPDGFEVPRVAALAEKTEASDDPEQDAWGRSQPALRVVPLSER